MFSPLFLLTLWIFLLPIALDLSAQKKIGNSEYPEILWGKDQEFSQDEFPNGSFVYHKKDFIFARGKLFQGDPPPSRGSFQFQDQIVTNSGLWNNQIIEELLNQERPDFKKAIQKMEAGAHFDPHFFAFRYNLGRLYTMDLQFDKALAQFEFAKAEVPDYHRTYLHIAHLSERGKDLYYANLNYKEAYKKNPFYSEPLVRLADQALESGSKNKALIYLKKAMEIEEESPNVKLGFAKLEIEKGSHFVAYKIFTGTSLSTQDGKEKNYDKKFHYFFAETASKIGDYEKAEEEYSILLKFPTDPFFSSFSYKVIQRRRDIARKFAEAKRSQSEDSEAVSPDPSE